MSAKVKGKEERSFKSLCALGILLSYWSAHWWRQPKQQLVTNGQMKESSQVLSPRPEFKSITILMIFPYLPAIVSHHCITHLTDQWIQSKGLFGITDCGSNPIMLIQHHLNVWTLFPGSKKEIDDGIVNNEGNITVFILDTENSWRHHRLVLISGNP